MWDTNQNLLKNKVGLLALVLHCRMAAAWFSVWVATAWSSVRVATPWLHYLRALAWQKWPLGPFFFHYRSVFLTCTVTVVMATCEPHFVKANKVLSCIQEKFVAERHCSWMTTMKKKRFLHAAESEEAFTIQRMGHSPKSNLSEFVQEQRTVPLPVSMELIQAKMREMARDRGMSSYDFKANVRKPDFPSATKPRFLRSLLKNFILASCYYIALLAELPAEAHRQCQSNASWSGHAIASYHFREGLKTRCVSTTGNEKTRVTVMLSCMANDHELPLFVVFKPNTMLKGEDLPKNVIKRCHNKD